MRTQRLTVILLAFYFTFVGGGAYYNLFFPVRMAHHIIVTGLIIVWLVQRLRKRRGLPVTGVDAPLYAAVGMWLLNSMTSTMPRMSFETLWFTLLHLMMFIYVVHLIRRGWQRLVMDALFFMVAMVIFFTGLELGSWFFGWGIIPGTDVGWITTGRLPSLQNFPMLALAMSISTLLAGYTAPLITITLGWALTTKRRDYRIVLFSMAFLLLVTLVLTSSRGGALSLIAALGILALFRMAQHPLIRQRLSPPVLLGGGAVLIAASILALVLILIPRGNESSNRGRLDMLQGAAQMVVDYPLTGVGHGQYGRMFRDYRDASMVQDKLASAHNVYANIAAETGLLGIGVALWLALAWVWRVWQHWQQVTSWRRKMRIEVMVATLLGLAVHSMVDVFSTTPLVLLIVTAAAYAITPQPKSRLDVVDNPPTVNHWAARLALVGFAVYGVWLLQLDAAMNAYLDGNRPTADVQQTRIAIERDPYLNLYYLHEAFLIGGDEQRALADRIAAYEAALQREPTWWTGWMNLASLYEQQYARTQDDAVLQQAWQAITQAWTINRRSEAAIHRARLGAQTGQLEAPQRTAHYVAGCLARLHQYLPLSSFWQQTEARIQGALQCVEQEQSTATLYRVRRVLTPEQADKLVLAQPQTAQDAWIAGEHALTITHDVAGAIDYFTQAIDQLTGDIAYPGDYYASRARAYIAAGQIEAAQRDLDMAAVLPGRDESVNAIRATITDDADIAFDLRFAAWPIRTVPQEFAAVLYNRPAVFDLMLPVRSPGYGRAALEPWYQNAYALLDAGATEQAQRWFQFIREHAPFDAEAQAALAQLSLTANR